MTSGTVPLTGIAAGPAGRRRSVFVRSLRQRRTRIGIGLTAFVVLIAVFGPLIAPHSSTDIVSAPIQGPSGAYPLGTDYLGRDVLSRVLSGGRTVVWMSFAAATLGVALGAALGMLAGYSRSWLDGGIMRTLDVVLAFPQVVL